MIVQIYGIMTAEDGVMVSELGADHVGLVAGEHSRSSDEVSFETARRIFAALPSDVVTVGLTVAHELGEIEEMARTVRPDILHLAADPDFLGPEAIVRLRRRLPGQRLMRSIPVSGPDAVATAARFQEVADYLLLDTRDLKTGAIGVTGQTHDWSISQRIVEAVRVPVVLAGGLGPGNVAEAIRAVRPWGVDSHTRTNRDQGPLRKDSGKVRRFIDAVRSVR